MPALLQHAPAIGCLLLRCRHGVARERDALEAIGVEVGRWHAREVVGGLGDGDARAGEGRAAAAGGRRGGLARAPCGRQAAGADGVTAGAQGRAEGATATRASWGTHEV